MIELTIYKKRTGRKVFDIRCNLIENGLPSLAPSRMFEKSTKSWRLPIVRVNVDYLKRNIDKIQQISDEAKEELDRARTPVTGDDWPSRYPFKIPPLPHQLEGLKRLYPIRNPGVFCDIGTGKSKIAVDTASCRYLEGSIGKVMVICLVSIKHNWEEEIIKNCPIHPSILSLNTTKSGEKQFNQFMEEDGFRWLIVGIESLSAGKAFDLAEKFVDDQTMIIVDESHSIKNHSATRTERCIQLSEHTTYRMIMTGTPITQGIIDFYSQFEFLSPEIIGIGDYYAFRGRYAIMGGHDGKNIIGYQMVDELLAAVNPHIYQVRKREVLKDLPESTYQIRYVDMSKEQIELYAQLKDTLMMMYDGNLLTVKSSINLMQRFSELTGGYYSYLDEEAMNLVPDSEKVKNKYKKEYLKTNPKADELMQFIEPLPNDEPVIIWSVSKMEIAYLVDRFKKKYGGHSVAQIHGSISETDKTKELDRFVSGGSRFLIGNQGVGGVGLNMVNCAIMVYYSNDFSLIKRIQSEGRIERIGQLRPMLYVDMVCKNSIDHYVVKALRDKHDFAEVVRSAFDNGTIGGIL